MPTRRRTCRRSLLALDADRRPPLGRAASGSCRSTGSSRARSRPASHPDEILVGDPPRPAPAGRRRFAYREARAAGLGLLDRRRRGGRRGRAAGRSSHAAIGVTGRRRARLPGEGRRGRAGRLGRVGRRRSRPLRPTRPTGSTVNSDIHADARVPDGDGRRSTRDARSRPRSAARPDGRPCDRRRATSSGSRPARRAPHRLDRGRPRPRPVVGGRALVEGPPAVARRPRGARRGAAAGDGAVTVIVLERRRPPRGRRRAAAGRGRRGPGPDEPRPGPEPGRPAWRRDAGRRPRPDRRPRAAQPARSARGVHACSTAQIVEAGDLVASVKVAPHVVERRGRRRGRPARPASAPGRVVWVAPFVPRRVGGRREGVAPARRPARGSRRASGRRSRASARGSSASSTSTTRTRRSARRWPAAATGRGRADVVLTAGGRSTDPSDPFFTAIDALGGRLVRQRRARPPGLDALARPDRADGGPRPARPAARTRRRRPPTCCCRGC